MSERKKPYPFDVFEPKWQQIWDERKTFKTGNPGDEGFDASRPKCYVLDMFPYPSGAGLHVGHPEGYTATDIVARFKRMNGFNVLHPMGWDSFGLPAEQYAIKTGQHPAITTFRNIDNFRRQLKMLGFSYDWDREIATTDHEYVRWTQWIFLRLYNSYYNRELKKARPVSELEAQGLTREEIDQRRLAYVAEVAVNWSPDLGTVLANEEVEEWKAKGHHVERRPLRQWMLRITDYAERLIDELEPLDWPESIKLLQRNWIGKSEGAEVDFELGGETITVYTTRPDTLFGATYMVLSPEHPLVDAVTTPERKEAVEQYRAQHDSLVRIDLERYAARLEQAQRDCKDRFRKDILFRMKDDIFNARRQFRELNKVMEQLTYGEEVYRFELEPSRDPQLAAFYQVIVDKGNQQMTEGDSLDNLAATADPAYERQVDALMEKIMADVDENTRARQEGRTGTTTLSDYVDYRTYLDYDIKVTNRVTGQQAYLSRVSRDSSGGENQAPFYVAICASLLQIYQKSENSIRLVLLDEAFSKMTSDRIRPMMELFRRLQLQVLLISTVEKSTAIQPYCDITYSIVRHGDANAIAPFVRLSAE